MILFSNSSIRLLGITLLAFVLTAFVEACGCEEQSTGSANMTDLTFEEAISESQATLDDFLSAFSSRQRAQTDFMVTCLRGDGAEQIPYGILVQEYDNDTITGIEIQNSLIGDASNRRISCKMSDIIDWRYVDSFEMVGGAVYRALYSRLPRHVQFRIRDVQPFLIVRDTPVDSDSLKVFRSVANGRCDALQETPPSVLQTVEAPMPILTFDIGRRVTVVPVTVPEYVAMYGSRETVNLTHELNLFRVIPDEANPIVDSAYSGNIDTTTRLIELGYDVNGSDLTGDTPLIQATKWNHIQVVEVLLASGANPNRASVRKQTPLFFATSLQVAAKLVAAGADIHAVDDNGDSCLAVAVSEGKREIVRFLVESGASLTYGATGVITESRVDGREALREWLEQSELPEQEVRNYLESESIDFGHVLPVKSISGSVE